MNASFMVVLGLLLSLSACGSAGGDRAESSSGGAASAGAGVVVESPAVGSPGSGGSIERLPIAGSVPAAVPPTPEATGLGVAKPSDAAVRAFIASHPSRVEPVHSALAQLPVAVAAGTLSTPRVPKFGANRVKDLSTCSSVSLVSDHPTATYDATGQYVVKGQTIVWTAAGVCPRASAPQYRFVLLGTDGVWRQLQDWSTSNTYSWDSTGLQTGFLTIQAWVRNGDSGSYQAYTGTGIMLNDAAPCPGVTVTSDHHVGYYGYAVKGDTVHWSAASPCDGQPRYKFWLLGPGSTSSYVVARDWSPSSTFDWNTTGLASGYWTLIVYVSNVSFYDAYYEAYTSSTIIVNDYAACTRATLTSDDADSYAVPGQQVHWTATSTCAGPAEYRFVFDDPSGVWHEVQPWSSNNTFTWDTTNQPLGYWNMQVWVRDASFYDYEQAYGSSSFILNSSQPCLDIASTAPSLVVQGSLVPIHTTVAQCTTSEFQIVHMLPGGGAFQIESPYSAANSDYLWNSSGAAIGTHTFEVWTRTQGSPQQYQTYSSFLVNVTPATACTPSCAGKTCGSDGCGGICGSLCGAAGICKNADDCPSGLQCEQRSADPASPSVCVAASCTSACSASCPCSSGSGCASSAECAVGFTCTQGACSCQPSCTGKACGAPDGCGGVCADGCGPGDACQSGGCLAGLTCSPISGGSTTTNVCMALGLPLQPPKTRPYATLPSDADAILPSSDPGQYAAGRLAGTSNVDSAGAFSYRVPIEVPHGRGGMEPHLAFSYSSSGGNGLLGVGWNLEGTSSIARCRQVVAREGVPDSVKVKLKLSCVPGTACQEQSQQYDDRIDNFCLDGQKLVKVGGTPTSPEFRTERDSFARIVATYSGDNWPSKFTVWNRDGTIATYLAGIVGTGVDSRDTASGQPNGASFSGVLAWPIDSLQDRFGNGVSYSYDAADQGSAAQVLTTIEYTTCAPGSACPYGGATRIVRFNYESRLDYLSHWVAGLNAGIAIRLRSVKVSTQNAGSETLVRSYNLGYDASGATGRSRLTTIAPCGINGCLASTTFQWGSGQGSGFRNTWHVLGPDAPGTVAPGQCMPGNVAPGCFWATYNTLDMQAMGGIDNPYMVGDFDGNGSDDLIFYTGSDESVTFWLALSHPANGAVTFETVRLNSSGNYPALSSIAYYYARAVDIDQDGQSELVLQEGHNGDTGFVVDDYAVYRYNAASKDFAPLVREDGSAVVLNTSSPVAPAGAPSMLDVNGDGVLDYFYDRGSFQDDGHSHAYSLSKAILSSASLLPGNYTTAVPFSYAPTPGDEDLFNQGRCRLQPVDYAGHGYRAPGLTCDDVSTSTFFADLNGDGLEDILKINAGVFNFATLRLSTGVELAGDLFHEATAVVHPEGQALPPLPLANAFESSSSAFSNEQNQVADFNADGLADIVQFNTGTVSEPPALWLTGTSDSTGATLTKVVLPYTRPRNLNVHDQRVGDFNGDGLPDIVQAVDFAASSNSGKLQFLIQDPSNRDDVITKVTSDSVELADLTYQSSPTEQLGPDGTDAVVPVGGVFTPRRGLNVVKKATLVEGDTRASYSYYYTQPAADTLGRGFLGFGSIVRADWLRGTRILSSFDNTHMEGSLHGYHLFPYAFTPNEVYTETDSQALVHLQWDAGPVPLSNILVTRSQYSAFARKMHPLNPTGGVLGPTTTYFTEDYLSSITKQDESGSAYYTGNVYRTYDDFGNLTDSTSEDGLEQTSVHSNFVNDTSANWLVSQLQDSTTTAVRNDPAVPSNTQTTTPHVLKHTYGDNGELRTVTDTPNGWRTQTFTVLTPDSAGLVRSVDTTDAFGNERGSSFDYSADGVYKEHIQDALGHDTWVGYHSGLGVPLISFDANGNQTLYRYDGFGRPRVTVPTRAPTTNITYEQSVGAMTVAIQQSPGTTVTKQYTDLGKLGVLYTNIAGRTSVVEYDWDNLARLESQRTPRFVDQSTLAQTTYSYDNLNNVRSVRKPDGSTVSINLLDGLTTETITSSSDDKTRDVVVTKTEDGLVASVRENSPSDAVTTRGVDYVYGQGKQIVQVNELGGPTTTYYSYGQSKPSYVVSSESGTTTLIYDGFGNPQSVIHDPAFPAREDYEFDSLGRLTLLSTTTPDTAHPGQTLSGKTVNTYDIGQGAIGQLSSSTSPDGVLTRYNYTPEGLLTEKEYESGPDIFQLGYHRDAYGRVDHVDYPETGQPRFGVDLSFNDTAGGAGPDGSLSAVSRNGGNYWSTLARGPTGMAESVLLGGDSTETVTVNPATRRIDSINVVSSAGEPAYNVAYGYFVGGNVKTRIDNVAGTDESYEYDGYDQLSKWSFTGPGGAQSENYVYDGLGNQTATGKYTKTFGGDGYSPHQLAKQSATQDFVLDLNRYEYDPLGRQTSWSRNLVTQRTVTYTPFDLPRSITTTQPTPRTVNYAYDADQHKFSESDGTATTTYIDDLYERRVDSATGITNHIFYVFADGKRIAQVVQSGTSETTTRLYSDVSGSVTGADQGAPASRQAFSPWGERLSLSSSSQATPIADVTTGFADQEHDDSVGLINMRGRVYDPVTRTFLTPDPIVGSLKIGGWNKYAYVLNNPLKYVDPSGLDPTDPNDPDVNPVSSPVPDEEVITDPLWVVGPPPPSVSPTNADGGSGVDPGQATDSTTQAASIEQNGAGPTLDSFVSLEPGANPFPDAGGSACGNGYTCGDLPGVDALRNSSNVINHPDFHQQAVDQENHRLAEYDRGAPTGGDPLDPLGVAAGVVLPEALAPELLAAAGTERALVAADLGLSGKGIANLSGAVVDAGTTRIVSVANITATTRGALVSQLRGAVPSMLNAARAEGVQTLQISASFANAGLAEFALGQAAQYGGIYSSVGGQETLTFVLGAW